MQIVAALLRRAAAPIVVTPTSQGSPVILQIGTRPPVCRARRRAAPGPARVPRFSCPARIEAGNVDQRQMIHQRLIQRTISKDAETFLLHVMIRRHIVDFDFQKRITNGASNPPEMRTPRINCGHLAITRNRGGDPARLASRGSVPVGRLGLLRPLPCNELRAGGPRRAGRAGDRAAHPTASRRLQRLVHVLLMDTDPVGTPGYNVAHRIWSL